MDFWFGVIIGALLILGGMYFTGFALKYQEEAFIRDGIILHEGKHYQVIQVKEEG